MEGIGIIRIVMSLLAMLAGLYSILIFIRLLLSWFGHGHGQGHTRNGKFTYFLDSITAPYLDWWRQRFRSAANMPFDFSPIAALAALSIIQTVCSRIANYGTISLGSILSIMLSVLWSAASFIIGFCVIVLVLRFIGYKINCNMYSPFWQVIDVISRDLLYRITRIFFKNRIVPFLTGIFISIAALVGLWIAGWFARGLLDGLLHKMPY